MIIPGDRHSELFLDKVDTNEDLPWDMDMVDSGLENAERKFFPGYVLTKMEMTDETYHMVKALPKVSGFLGHTQGKPSAVPESEINKILQDIEEGVTSPKPSITFEVGEQVRVSDGPFASFNGLVEEIDEERSRVKVSVSIFGRSTPVELEYTQVEKA